MAERVPDFAPSHGDGKDVGAWDDRDATEWATTLNDVRDYGAVMDGSTDDSGAIEAAMKDSTGSDEAAYIPADGVAGMDYRIEITPSMNGATLVGDGYDSVTRQIGDGIREAFRIHSSVSSPVNVTLANFRHDGNYPTLTRQHWAIEFKDDYVAGHDILLENLWVHDCESSCIQIEIEGVTVRNCSLWSTTAWHGFGLRGNHPSGSGNRTRIERCFVWDCRQYAYDCSGSTDGDITIKECLAVNNEYGAKATKESTDAILINCLFENNRGRGFTTTGTGGGNVRLENVISRHNGHSDNPDHPPHGFGFYDMNTVTGTNIYSIDNYNHGVMVWDDGTTATFDLDLVETGANDLKGFTVVDTANGSIETIRGQNNEDGLTGETSNITIKNMERAACDPPDVLPDRMEKPSAVPAIRRTNSKGRYQTTDSGLYDI